MAATWRALAANVAYANTKSMADLYNATGTARVIRVYRVFIHPTGVTSVTGQIEMLQIRRATAMSIGSGSTVTPVKHDTGSSALDANTTAGTNRTITASDIFRRFMWVVDDPIYSSQNQVNWQCLIPNTEVWNSGYADSNIEPIVCRSTFGMDVYAPTVLASSGNDFEIEFTDAGS